VSARRFSVACGKSEASGWTFYLLALARGWDVGKPKDNGFGYFFVDVYDDTDGEPRAHEPYPKKVVERS
jgi:hypothetical protein